MSFITSTSTELIYASAAIGAPKASMTASTEFQINDVATMGVQAHLPVDFWLPSPTQIGRGIKIYAKGILSSTGTPGYTLRIRAGATGAGAANTTSVILLGTTPVVGTGVLTTSGVPNAQWELEGEIFVTAMGAAGANTSIIGNGMFKCPGLATPFLPLYAAVGNSTTTASPGTAVTAGQVLDTTIANYINFNFACSAVANASNTVTLQQLLVWGLN
jgi:hypothetical protein